MLTSSLILGCVVGSADTAETAEVGQTIDPPDASGLITLGDDNNYAFDGRLDGPTISLAAESDATIDFADLDKDLQCHDLDPVADIDNVALLMFRYLTETEVEAGLSTDSLAMADMSLYISYEPGDATSFRLSDLSFFGTDPEIEGEFKEGNGSFLVLLTSGTTVGSGARMIGFLEPSASETSTSGVLDDGCSVLDYEADLTSLKPLAVLPSGPWTLDWTAATQTGQATELVDTKVTSVMLAYYAELTMADLETQFLDIELLADRTWTLEHAGGTTADLSLLLDASDGSAFTGFEAEGTYLLALRCGTCPSPAPLVLTQLVPWRE